MSDFMTHLNELRKKHPSSITDADRAFLKARRDYLHEHELKAFGIEEPEAEEVETAEEAAETPEQKAARPAKKAKPAKAQEPA